MSSVEGLHKDMWEEKHGILLSSTEFGGFGRAFPSGVLGAEGKNKCCLKKKGLSLQNKPAGLHMKVFPFLGNYSIMQSYTGFCYRRGEKS